ncbi:ATP-dependent Lon protease pim1 [Desmophyllum pertusum]|uniref:ATP-dependent Lon protease pim1 n=1 Tax=Desmophyllum pertusum TaxID=174260 RepID=A0A9W9ZPM7_9CNID|nr:ATP-dependent Lon protease pim1 [Desmophyllum pertusum]
MKRKLETESAPTSKRMRTEKRAALAKKVLLHSKETKLRLIWSESDIDYLKKISSYDSFLPLDYKKPDWVNAEMRFTLSADSAHLGIPVLKTIKLKLSKVPDYIKKLASQTELAAYDIGKVLGAGSFGQVIAATRKADNLPVALKFVQKSSVKEFKKMNTMFTSWKDRKSAKTCLTSYTTEDSLDRPLDGKRSPAILCPDPAGQHPAAKRLVSYTATSNQRTSWWTCALMKPS